jgi:hypothetical protein
MRIIVTHNSPDLDAIFSVWVIKRYLPGWQDSKTEYVPAGTRLKSAGKEPRSQKLEDAIEKFGENEIIHVDTGLGPLDHHQIPNDNLSAASLSLDFVVLNNETMKEETKQALRRLANVVVDDDHFKDVFWPDPTADYHDFNLTSILDGLKLEKPNDDNFYTSFISVCFDSLLHQFENRIWAEKEIKEVGIEFNCEWGKALGIETINDSIVKLAQLMGYNLVVRKDPRKGYVRIKATPRNPKIDLTNTYEQLKKMDPDATWFLHVSKKMLLNGTTKNPNMVPSKLTLRAIIGVLKK